MTQWEKKMKTGQDVNQDGVYSSDCCLHEKELAKKQSFPRCPKCMSLTVWLPVTIRSSGLNLKNKAA
jgi:hypothetical protein